jgi:hypothetical protein
MWKRQGLVLGTEVRSCVSCSEVVLTPFYRATCFRMRPMCLRINVHVVWKIRSHRHCSLTADKIEFAFGTWPPSPYAFGPLSSCSGISSSALPLSPLAHSLFYMLSHSSYFCSELLHIDSNKSVSQRQSQSYITTDSQSVSQYVLVSSPIWDFWPEILQCRYLGLNIRTNGVGVLHAADSQSTSLRTKDCCTHSLLHAQQDALTQYKDCVFFIC